SPAERAWRWCRRNKAAAGLLAASAVAALALVGIVVGTIYNARLKATNHDLRLAREAEKALHYFNSMMSAEREWLASNVGRAEQVLDQDCPVLHRGWEWHYLKRMCHSDLLTLTEPGVGSEIAFSPDGSLIASASNGSFLGSSSEVGLRIWDAARG